MKIQITEELELREDENWRVNLHSFFNIIQVLFNELNILKMIIGESEYISNAFKEIRNLNETLSNPSHTISSFKNLNNFKSIIFNEIDKAVINTYNLDDVKLNKLEELLINLDRMVRVLEDRTKDFLRYITHKEEWVKFDTFWLEDKLKDVLLTMGLRAKGKYGITFNKKLQKSTDYYFDIDLASNFEEIALPALFPDIIRDIVANAKKYSEPGTTIECKLSKNAEKVFFTVKDYGRGIPECEIPNVVKFGFRASNVTPDETMGDGFGLTKAYLVTCQNNGKMWIDSKINSHTEVSIEIPIPN